MAKGETIFDVLQNLTALSDDKVHALLAAGRISIDTVVVTRPDTLVTYDSESTIKIGDMFFRATPVQYFAYSRIFKKEEDHD